MKCKCIKDWNQTTIKYLGKGKHSEPFEKTIFKKGDDCFYRNDNKQKIIYVADTEQHISRIDYYNMYVEELEQDEFNIHFEKNN